jgi:transposase
MTVMEAGSEILKVDEVGRVRTPPEKRQALLTEFDRSGMSGAQFARFVGVRYSTLMYWLQRRRKEAGRSKQVAAPRPNHPRWLEARVAGEVSRSENVVVEMGRRDGVSQQC